MILDVFRIIGALFLILFLPGFFFIQALFPKKNELDEDNDLLYRFILSVAMSVMIVIIIGFILGSIGINEKTQKGYFQAPYILLTLISFSLVMFSIGVYRGAFPILFRRTKTDSQYPIAENTKLEFFEIMQKWRDLKEKISRIEMRISEEPAENKKKLTVAKARYLRQLNKLEAELKYLGESDKKIKSEARRLHDLINKWKELKKELELCENRLKLCKGDLRDRNQKIKDDLQAKIDDVEKKISFIREE